MKERNTTLETTDHNNRNNSENIKETPDERIPGKLIGAIVAVGSLAFSRKSTPQNNRHHTQNSMRWCGW